jgi:hypothetical protein
VRLDVRPLCRVVVFGDNILLLGASSFVSSTSLVEHPSYRHVAISSDSCKPTPTSAPASFPKTTSKSQTSGLRGVTRPGDDYLGFGTIISNSHPPICRPFVSVVTSSPSNDVAGTIVTPGHCQHQRRWRICTTESVQRVPFIFYSNLLLQVIHSIPSRITVQSLAFTNGTTATPLRLYLLLL